MRWESGQGHPVGHAGFGQGSWLGVFQGGLAFQKDGFSLVSRETRGNKDFWTRMEKVFKMIQFPVLIRRCPRAWWSIQAKSDHRFLAYADQRPPAPAGSAVVTKQGLAAQCAQKPML